VPLFRTKKEPFEWLKSGKKTIDVRKGNPCYGEVAVFLSGRNVLRMKILKKRTGKLTEIVRTDNFRLIVLSALVLDDAIAYLRELYADTDGVSTAYYVVPTEI